MSPGSGRADKYEEWQKTGSATGEGAFGATEADKGGSGVVGGIYDSAGALAGKGGGAVKGGVGAVAGAGQKVVSTATNPLLRSDLQKTVAKDTKRNQQMV
jgi:hypothetical protein